MYASPSQADTVFREGVLTFVDNNVDTSSGTVLLKGEFQNRDNVLWPGQFLNVRLQLYIDDKALRSEEHTSELQSHSDLVCRLLLEKKKNTQTHHKTHQHER